MIKTRIKQVSIERRDKELQGAIIGTQNWILKRLKELGLSDISINQINDKIETVIALSGEAGKWVEFTKEERGVRNEHGKNQRKTSASKNRRNVKNARRAKQCDL